MKNKIISVALVLMLALSSVLVFSGCGDGEYPVEVANIKISSEPKNIVVLDASTADIIECIGYEVKMVGRSDEVNQKSLSAAPSVGSAQSPDINKIIDIGADLVFVNDSLSDESRAKLDENKINVVNIAVAGSQKQLETTYTTVGRILGGNTVGAAKGEEAYSKLISQMEDIKSKVTAVDNNAALNTVCYMYSVNGKLRLTTSGTYGDMLLGYTGCVNVAVNIDENKVEVNTLKVANPNYLFYSDEQTLQAIKDDSVLSGLSAIKDGKTLMISADEMNRQGLSAINTLNKMVGFIHPELAVKDSDNESSDTSATEAVVKSVADDYKIKLDDDLSLAPDDENDNVKAMQQRLFDLGYIDDEENVTGYYGEVSKTAVSDFQSKNGLKDSGEADKETLAALFAENAKKK
ncbi:MAG: peptidoglycan-binding protein [Ruminococcus bromii]|nr:peptidoglycan-binding protein [Ruminococcus bromii]MCI7211098.1 peptidoglycan-binding protein [Ruminococcus bromii]MDD6434305.1 peptidoglycan-binding protein [Ruminococcus bromii]MDY4085003.1 peptidoglycan-binding protein [Ruminococcus bromii]MDY4710385.1 peptidoglycan-binding protein [Ruminococcus bromii]